MRSRQLGNASARAGGHWTACPSLWQKGVWAGPRPSVLGLGVHARVYSLFDVTAIRHSTHEATFCCCCKNRMGWATEFTINEGVWLHPRDLTVVARGSHKRCRTLTRTQNRPMHCHFDKTTHTLGVHGAGLLSLFEMTANRHSTRGDYFSKKITKRGIRPAAPPGC